MEGAMEGCVEGSVEGCVEGSMEGDVVWEGTVEGALADFVALVEGALVLEDFRLGPLSAWLMEVGTVEGAVEGALLLVALTDLVDLVALVLADLGDLADLGALTDLTDFADLADLGAAGERSLALVDTLGVSALRFLLSAATR